MKKYWAVLIILILGLGYLLLPNEKTVVVMGTTLRVKGDGARLAIDEVKRLDRLFSRFEPESDISKVNRAAGNGPVVVAKETFDLVATSFLLSDLSGGAFDLTLGRNGNYRAIVLDSKNRTIFLRHKGMSLDLGGIGKGAAVESARRKLLADGAKKTLIDMHSSIAVIGGPWKIGVIDPREARPGMSSNLLEVVTLNDGDALSTSGGYEQPGHIIDPRSGRVANRCLGVTVITRDAAIADALSTAIFVLGPEQGLKLANKLAAKAVIVDGKGKINDNFSVKLR
ncbi:MAG: FAD:protein FMN transferase [Candidatus Margulisiibacteriota bacterium]|jgi:thiamine biosynthesis lipoprotein